MNLLPLVPLLALFAFPHPHVPKAIVLQGAGGKTTLTWFTIHFNPEQVKTLPNGATWHLGFAALDVGMPLRAGATPIPVGKYKLDVLRDAQGEFSELQLVPMELLRARGRRDQPADPAAMEAAKKALAARGVPELIRLLAAKFDDPFAEHLEFFAITRGYETVERGSAEPKGGASFTLMATFGDLHRKVELVEVFGGGDVAPKK
jgi:hypothetical protein